MASSTSAEDCSICLSSLTQQGLDVFTTACKHQFHFQCLVKNVQAKNNECPLCRTRLDSLANILNQTQSNDLGQSEASQIPSRTSFISVQNVSSAPAKQRAIWGSLKRSLSGVFGFIGNSSSRPPSAISTMTRRSVLTSSTDNTSSEDLINEEAVRALAARIKAARQSSLENKHELPMIAVTATLEFGAQESTRQSNIYGMVSLKAPTLFSAAMSENELDELHIPIDVICIVDQSGSMSGEKMLLLKQTLNYVVDQMMVLDRFAVVSFDTKAFDRFGGLKLMTDDKKETVRTAIRQQIHPSGGTHIGCGLEMAIRLLKNRHTRNSLGAMLLLTDGQDNNRHDYRELMESVPEGVVCHTFGYGVGHNAALLSQLAEQGNGGTFTYIDQVDAIGPSFAIALGGLFTCIAKQLRVKVEFDRGYKITHTHTAYEHEPKRLPSRQLTFKMTDLNADESRNLVFQLAVPKVKSGENEHRDDHVIGHAHVEYTDTNSEQAIRTPSVPFTLARPNQLDPHSPLLQVNYTLDLQRNRAETSQVLKQAVEAHDYEHARELINAQLAKIRSAVSAQGPLCQQLIHDLEYQYSSHHEFKRNMTNICMQHGQERATYSTNTTISAACYETKNQERYRKKCA